LRFDAFTLDLARCLLLRGDADLRLRPQAFDMLRYLAAHPGRLVSKSELMEAIWPGVTVGDDSLVRCVRDIREALGDREHRIVKTLPKRGYMFAVDVSEADIATDPELPPAATHLPQLGLDHWQALLSRVIAGRLRGGARGAVLLGVGALVAIAGVAVWAVWAMKDNGPTARAAHYALLGQAILEREHTAGANTEAVALFDKALALDPNSVSALLGYARAMVVGVTDGWAPRREHAARFDQAEAAIDRAIRLDARHARAYHLLGLLLRARGEPERAIAALERALALDPGSAWAHALMGRSKIDVGRAEEAIADIRTAIRLSPNDPRLFNLYYWIGMAAVHAGKSETALEWLLKWREPNQLFDRLASPWLAVTYADLGEEQKARAHLARVPNFTMAAFGSAFPAGNPVVARQRERIAAVLRRLGVPEGEARVEASSLR
jgi:DNA-binding winged helix-turn-helix (wHTH) protein/Tfp pilus assembly protein PilF